MHEIDLADPYGLDPFEGLDPTPAEVDVLREVMAELDDDEIAGLAAEGAAELDDSPAADFARMNRALDSQMNRDADRVAEDRADSRRGRTSVEGKMARALDRYSRGTYLPGQADPELSNPLFDADDFGGPAVATPEQVLREMTYRLTGQGSPVTGRVREPLPPVAKLARMIGVRS